MLRRCFFNNDGIVRQTNNTKITQFDFFKENKIKNSLHLGIPTLFSHQNH